MESPLEVLHRAATIMAQENANGKLIKLSLFLINLNKIKQWKENSNQKKKTNSKRQPKKYKKKNCREHPVLCGSIPQLLVVFFFSSFFYFKIKNHLNVVVARRRESGHHFQFYFFCVLNEI